MEIIVPKFVPQGKKLGLGQPAEYQVRFHYSTAITKRCAVVSNRTSMIGSSRDTRDSVLLLNSVGIS
jgi:hypothetical protein